MSFLRFQKILVGVALGGGEKRHLSYHEQVLIKTVTNLALKLGAVVRLVHVVESTVFPWFESSSDNLNQKLDNIASLEEEEKQLLSSREVELEGVKEMLSSSLPVETSVLSAPNAARGLLVEALLSNCDMICIGSQKRTPKLLPSSMSTILTLMTEAELPVLVCPEGAAPDLWQRGVVALLADDLRVETSFAIVQSVGFILQLSGTALHHVHVNPIDQNITGNTNDIRKRVMEKMTARVHYEKEKWGRLSVTYEPHVLTGNVSKAVDRLKNAVSANLMVFGHHRKFHTRPLSLGAVTFRAMMEYGEPLAIFPDSITVRRLWRSSAKEVSS